MLIYELFESIKFNCDYNKILDLIDETNGLVLKKNTKDKIDIDYNKFGKYKDLVIEFVATFYKSFNEEQTNNMLRNLSTLKIVTATPLEKVSILGLTSMGFYDSTENIITLITSNKKYIKETLFHELLHMASTVSKEDNKYCGFDLDNVIGTGINEDYTEYLLEKYFNKESKYDRRSCLLQELLLVVGEKKTEELYFKADLPSLINELAQYKDEKEVIKLIYDYDSLYNVTYANNLINKLEHKMDRILKQKVKVKNNMI